MARLGSSFRNVSRIAVRAVSGSSVSPAAANGATAQGSGVACSSQSPMTEFQNPSTLQGAAIAKQTNISPSTMLQPGGEHTGPKQPQIGHDVEGGDDPAAAGKLVGLTATPRSDRCHDTRRDCGFVV